MQEKPSGTAVGVTVAMMATLQLVTGVNSRVMLSD